MEVIGLNRGMENHSSPHQQNGQKIGLNYMYTEPYSKMDEK